MSVERMTRFCPRCGVAIAHHERFGRIRPNCESCGHVVFYDPKVAVATFVTDADDSRVLLVQRAHDPAKGKWALPAGFVEYDESPEHAACRETLEETGLIVRVTRLIQLLHRPDADGLADIVIVYAASVVGGTLCAQDDALACAWFTADNLPEIGLVSTQQVLSEWAAGKR
jgi:8-oxo-dGTP diphosphatase